MQSLSYKSFSDASPIVYCKFTRGADEATRLGYLTYVKLLKADMNSDILLQTAAIFFLMNCYLKQVIG